LTVTGRHEKMRSILEIFHHCGISMSRSQQVAVLIETSNAYGRGLLRGVMAFVREHAYWIVQLAEHGRGEVERHELADWRGHGLLARIENSKIAAVVRSCARHTVDLSAARLLPHLPWVETDDAAIARLAAEHLLERGLRHFGYCGDPRFNWSKWRQEHFCKHLAESGYRCAIGPTPRGGSDELADWVRALSKPVGVMTCYDIRGREVLAACRRARVAVPDQVAVIGVDNDELLCELSDPPLSSIEPDSRRAGWVAAELLQSLMTGRRARSLEVRIPPIGVTTRHSTDTLAVDDPDLAHAVRIIRAHACSGLRVADIVARLPLSRRVFESRFEKVLGRTPHAEILRVRLEQVKKLLRGDWSLDAIARHTGFQHGEYLSTVFKRELGETPGRFRARSRNYGGAPAS
jgi:LacI family transcriptional regulator